MNNTFSQPLPIRPRRRGRRLFTFTLLLVWLAVLGLVAANRQVIFDWWVLREYKAPAAVATLATQDTMTDQGRKIFYVNKPVIDDKTAFAKACPQRGGEQTIVLGCYHGGQSGIFLLRVDDPRLNGVLQVTAAHEMLHGAYERLSGSERKRVDAMLFNYYENGLQDERIRKTIDAYKKSEPNDVVNEMHSIFATEVTSLPDNLEQYYRQYFTDRAQVAAYAAQYQAQFTDREEQVARYDAQLTQLRARIDETENSLQSKQRELNATQERLLAHKNKGDVASYNAGVPGYNDLVTTYNAEIQTVRDLIAQYNQLVEARNAVALEQGELVKSLDANALPSER